MWAEVRNGNSKGLNGKNEEDYRSFIKWKLGKAFYDELNHNY